MMEPNSELEKLLVNGWVHGERRKLLARCAELEGKVAAAEKAAQAVTAAARQERERERAMSAKRANEAKELVRELARRAAQEESLRISLQKKLGEVLRQSQLWERRAALAQAKFAKSEGALRLEREGRAAWQKDGAVGKRQRRREETAERERAVHVPELSDEVKVVEAYVEGLLRSHEQLRRDAVELARRSMEEKDMQHSRRPENFSAPPTPEVGKLLNIVKAQDEIEKVMDQELAKRDAQAERLWRLAIRWCPLVDMRGHDASQDLKALGLLDQFMARGGGATPTNTQQPTPQQSSYAPWGGASNTWPGSSFPPSSPTGTGSPGARVQQLGNLGSPRSFGSGVGPGSPRSTGSGKPMSPSERVQQLAEAGKARAARAHGE